MWAWSWFRFWSWSILQQDTIWTRSTVWCSVVLHPPCLDTLSCCITTQLTTGQLWYWSRTVILFSPLLIHCCCLVLPQNLSLLRYVLNTNLWWVFFLLLLFFPHYCYVNLKLNPGRLNTWMLKLGSFDGDLLRFTFERLSCLSVHIYILISQFLLMREALWYFTIHTQTQLQAVYISIFSLSLPRPCLTPCLSVCLCLSLTLFVSLSS